MFLQLRGTYRWKKKKKSATIKWRGVQQGIVVGGSGRTAEAEGRSELSGGGVGGRRGGKNVCVKENKRAKREGGGLAQTKGGGGLIKYVPMFVWMKAVTIAKFLHQQKQLQLCTERSGEIPLVFRKGWKHEVIILGVFCVTARLGAGGWGRAG